MRWSDITFAPSARALRQFAGIWLAFFAGLACWHGLWRQRPVPALVLAGLAAVGLLGLVKPGAIRGVYVAAQVATFPLGWTVSHFLVAVLFYGVFTPLGFLFRLLKRDPLQRQRLPDRATYWTPKPAAAGVRGYYRPF
jgi:hypothetical protein